MTASKLTIGHKLAFSFATVLMLLVIIGLVGWNGLQQVGRAHALAAESYRQALFQVRKEVDHLVWANDLGNVLLLDRDFRGQLDHTQCDFGQWYYAFRDTDAYRQLGADFRRIFEAIEQPHLLLHQSAREILRVLDQQDRRQGLMIYQEQTLAHLNTLRILLTDLGNALEHARAAIQARAISAAHLANWFMGGAALAAIAVAALLGLLLQRAIVKPLVATTAYLCSIAEGDGDLSRRLPVRGHDEIAALASAFNAFAERVQALVKQVVGAAAHLATAAEELSASSADTRRQLQDQRGEVTQIVTAMSEMAGAAREMASYATDAASTAHATDEQARAGGLEVQGAIAAIDDLAEEVEQSAKVIERLSDDSAAIGKILDVIREIAKRTNLLALNAAIEAARAGEQGRGFAVVADEVRTLAARTQASTNEVQAMIERLQSGANDAVQAMEQGRGKAREGVARVGKAGEALRAIHEAIRLIDGMSARIASAAGQQSAVADEANRNVANIGDGADRATTGATQIASASDELARLAAVLQDQVGRFKS